MDPEPASKPDIIFIHGMWSHGGVAAPLVKFAEARGFRVLCPNLPHHESEQDLAALGDCSIREYANAILDYIDTDGKGNPVLVGHSMGGLIAQMVAAEIEVEALVLLNSAAPAGINHIFPFSFWSTRSFYGTSRFWSKPNRLAYKVARFGLFNQLDSSLAREVYESLRYESGRAYAEIVYWWLDRGRATTIDQPVSGRKLILSGDRDRIVLPNVARSLARLYPEADSINYPENAHWIFFEPGSEKIYQDLFEWLEAALETGI